MIVTYPQNSNIPSKCEDASSGENFNPVPLFSVMQITRHNLTGTPWHTERIWSWYQGGGKRQTKMEANCQHCNTGLRIFPHLHLILCLYVPAPVSVSSGFSHCKFPSRRNDLHYRKNNWKGSRKLSPSGWFAVKSPWPSSFYPTIACLKIMVLGFLMVRETAKWKV